LGCLIWLNTTTKPTVVYLDTSVLTIWILIQEARGKRRKLLPRGQKCKELLDYIKANRFKCKFQISNWGISELVQTLMDNAILDSVRLDGHQISAFNKVKSNYPLKRSKRVVIHQAIADFEMFLNQHKIEVTEVSIKSHSIHEYCMKYALETPDAVHVLCAVRYSSNYLVTIDRSLINAKVKEIKIIDPGTLITKSELRFY
jgi:predicted nucleic acid-binding protein